MSHSSTADPAAAPRRARLADRAGHAAAGGADRAAGVAWCLGSARSAGGHED